MDNENKNVDMRVGLLERVVSDFTYKADFSQAQKAQWQMVKTDFETFRASMDDMLNEHNIAIGSDVDAYLGYTLALRETERWCNTAIANDFKTGSPVDMAQVDVSVPSYEGPSGGDLERHKVCDTISAMCFDLIVFLVSVLPMGRALSVAITRMQDVRGWLLDTVNFHYDAN